MNDDTSNGVIGSPTKLTPELINKAAEYLVVFRSEGDLVPTIAGLSCYLGISRSSVYNYKDKSADFLDILEKIEATQEKMLVNGGLSGDFNAPITKMMMTKHGYSDKQETEVTGKDGAELFPSIVVRYE